jgi:hypothetical protein
MRAHSPPTLDVARDVARGKQSSEANMHYHMCALACALKRSIEQVYTQVYTRVYTRAGQVTDGSTQESKEADGSTQEATGRSRPDKADTGAAMRIFGASPFPGRHGEGELWHKPLSDNSPRWQSGKRPVPGAAMHRPLRRSYAAPCIRRSYAAPCTSSYRRHLLQKASQFNGAAWRIQRDTARHS